MNRDDLQEWLLITILVAFGAGVEALIATVILGVWP